MISIKTVGDVCLLRTMDGEGGDATLIIDRQNSNSFENVDPKDD
jgi:hypothetical protein